MTQDERWLVQRNAVMAFMAENHRRPSKYNLDEMNDWNWIRHQQKKMNDGLLKPERLELFKKLVEMGEKYKHVNQYV